MVALKHGKKVLKARFGKKSTLFEYCYFKKQDWVEKFESCSARFAWILKKCKVAKARFKKYSKSISCPNHA